MSKLVERARAPRILLVEDCDGDVLLFRRTLGRVCPDVQLVVSHTAEAATTWLEQVVETPAEHLPDLVITDLNLPGMNGVELIGVLKRDPRFRRIPCLILTTSSARSDIDAAYDAYASGYLTKPDSIEDYTVMVMNMTAYWFTLMQVPQAGDAEWNILSRDAPDYGFDDMSRRAAQG